MMSIDVAKFDRLFNPKTAVVIGDKQALGYSWLNSMSTFKGPVYSVQIDEREIPQHRGHGRQELQESHGRPRRYRLRHRLRPPQVRPDGPPAVHRQGRRRRDILHLRLRRDRRGGGHRPTEPALRDGS